MKTLSLAVLLVASLAFVLLGCSDNSQDPIGTTSQVALSSNPATVLSKGGVVHSVTGSAMAYNIVDPLTGWILPGPKQKGGFYTVNTVNAIDHGNGNYSGRFVNQFQGKMPKDQVFGFYGKVEADVIYLAVEENKALVVGRITNWIGVPDWPAVPYWMAIVLIDNGEGGSNGSSDETGALWATSDPDDLEAWLGFGPQDYLDWTWTFSQPYGPTFRVDNGNIQVR